MLSQLASIICLSDLHLQTFNLLAVVFRVRVFLSILCGTHRSMLSDTIPLKLFNISSTLLLLLAHIPNLSRRRVCSPKHLCWVIQGLIFYLRHTTIFFPFNFQYYPVMITDPLCYTASGERTFGSEKVNVQQRIPSGWAIYYLSEPVFPYQTIYKCLSSTITTRVSIPICVG